MAVVILKKEMPNLGSLGEVVKVKDGYARNYLLPYGFAVVANRKNTKEIEHEKRMLEKQIKTLEDQALKDKAKLEKVKLSFARKASKTGRLFGSVTNRDIEAELKEQGIEVDRRNIEVSLLKELGVFQVPIKLFKSIRALIKVEVLVEEFVDEDENLTTTSSEYIEETEEEIEGEE